MKINELLVEEQLDELNLKGLGTGVGKVPGAIAGAAVQGAKNIWSGAKQGYQAGKNALAPDGSTPAPNTAPQSNVAPQATAPQQGSGAGKGFLQGMLQGIRQGGAQQPDDTQAGTAPQASTAPQSNAQHPGDAPQAGTAPQATATAPAPAMKSADIVKGLSDVWSKATANQGSMTGSPQVQQQIIAMAKDSGLAGRKIENRKNNKVAVVEFHSRFLGTGI